jgi:transcriptional regulator with XRE-family HTH domain
MLTMSRYKVDGEKVRRLRRARFLSQEQTAKLAGISTYTLSEIELGKRRAISRTVLRLSETLGVQPSDLVDEDF